MITPNEIDKSMDRLKAAISPPSEPIGLETKKLPVDLPGLPPDLFRFINIYGSGFFQYGGIFLEVLNPYEEDYWKKENCDLKLVREFKEQEGDEYIPFAIYPDSPGLYLWGYGQDRKHFFWLTDGDDPATWPVIVMYDIEIFTRFDMPMIVFIEKLLCGDIDCSFIGGVETPGNHIDSTSVKFIPGVLPA